MGLRLHLHLDPLGGVAGDMFLAALLDAHPELAEDTFAAMRAAGLPDSWNTRLVRHHDDVLGGHRLLIEAPAVEPGAPPSHFADIRAGLQIAPLPPAVRERAIAIFTELAEAEAAVHGVAVDEVHFHELADWDSVADIVGAAWLIEALAPASWSAGALPVGSGRITTRHGPLPVPAPATARLLDGFLMHDDGIAGERVTPTGAAILRHLRPDPRLPPGAWRLTATGNGFGTRRLPGISNMLRILAYHQDGVGGRTSGSLSSRSKWTTRARRRWRLASKHCARPMASSTSSSCRRWARRAASHAGAGAGPAGKAGRGDRTVFR